MASKRTLRSNKRTSVEPHDARSNSNVDLLSDLGVIKLKAVLIKPKIKFPNEDDTQNMNVKSNYRLRQQRATRKVYTSSPDDYSDGNSDNEDGYTDDTTTDDTTDDDDDKMEFTRENDKWFINDDDSEDEDSHYNIKRVKKSKSYSSGRLHSKRKMSKARTLQYFKALLQRAKKNSNRKLRAVAASNSVREEVIESNNRVLRPVKPGFVYKNAMDIEEIESDDEGEDQQRKPDTAQVDQVEDDSDLDVYTDPGVDSLVDELGDESESSIEFVGKILNMAKRLLAMDDESENDNMEDQVGYNNAKNVKKARSLKRTKRYNAIQVDSQTEDDEEEESDDNRSSKSPLPNLESDTQNDEVFMLDDTQYDSKLSKSSCKRKRGLRLKASDDEQDEEHEPLNKKGRPQHSSDESDNEHLNRENILKERTRGEQVSKFRDALFKLKDRRIKEDSAPIVLTNSSSSSSSDESNTDDDKDEDGFVVDDNIIDGVRMTENEEVISELNKEQMPAEFSSSRLKSWPSQYKTNIEYLVYQIIAGSKSQETDLAPKYDIARNTVKRRILGYRDSISTSDAWRPQFKAAMDKYRVWINNDSSPSSCMDCEACRNHQNNESRSIALCSENGEEDEIQFYVGTHCHGTGHMYHYLTHFEFHMKQEIKSEIKIRKYKTDVSGTQYLRRIVDNVFEKLLMSGYIKKSYNNFKNQMTDLGQAYSLKKHKLFLEEYSEDET